MATNDDGTQLPHGDGRTATPKQLRRQLIADATTDLEDAIASYRCRGCAERCLNGEAEVPTRALLCVDCCSHLLADLSLTDVRDELKLEADPRC